MTKFLSAAGRRDENHREERKDGRNAKALAAAPQASAALGRVHLSIQRRTRGLCVGPRLCVPLFVRTSRPRSQSSPPQAAMYWTRRCAAIVLNCVSRNN